jgi:hypothetical protein
MISIGSRAIARASATRRAMPPDSSVGIRPGRRAAHRVQFHEHQVADHGLRQIRMLAHLEGDVVENRHVGEKGAELEQHAHAAPQGIQPIRVEFMHHLAGHPDLAEVGFNWPPMRRRVVVLPQPEIPITATTLPRGIVMLIPVSTGRLS